MNMKETIEWHPASEPPDNDRSVMLLFSAAILRPSLGYFDFYREQPKWCRMDGFPITAPDYWAELPRGPK